MDSRVDSAPQPQPSKEDLLIRSSFDELLKDYLASNHRKRVEIITQAFNFANQAHRGVKRASGEPYILHPIAVARIVCTEIGLGSTSISAALLHDVVEDTDYTVEDIENIFGAKIAQLVGGLTKISGGIFGDKASAQAENFKKLLLTMNDDIRVILIKMADRLHNMRTLGSLPPFKQYKVAGETLYIYAPLAHRLGLNKIKTELEDLSFKYEHPEAYAAISQKLAAGAESREERFVRFTAPIREALDKKGMHYELKARVKSVYSIWNKMETKHVPFEEIYDLMAVRIIFDPEEGQDEVNICFQIYAMLTRLYKPHPDRFRDWVSHPKANGYQSLHVTLMSNEGEWIEVQIRSRRMDEIAEQGFAAHWKYKEGEGGLVSEEEGELDKWLKTIKEILDDPQPDAIDFLDTIKLNLFSSEIYVFTPKGDLKTMPQGATALDFAFSIHTYVGCHCIGAKVNHRLVPLSYRLQSGDQVEILTSKAQRVQPAWEDYVTTARAKSKIMSVLHKEQRATEKKGEEMLSEFLRGEGLLMEIQTIDRLMASHGFRTKDEMFVAIGSGNLKLGPEDVEMLRAKRSGKGWKKFIPHLSLGLGNRNKNQAQTAVSPAQLLENKGQAAHIDPRTVLKLTEQSLQKEVRIAPCCNPIPGDDVLGYVDDEGRIIIHKCQCSIAAKLKSSYGNRIVAARWDTHKELSFPVPIFVKGIDERGVLLSVVRAISEELGMDICSLNVQTRDGIFEMNGQIYVHDVEDVRRLLNTLHKIPDLQEVARLDGTLVPEK
ncbi:MAG: RelA/SpoT family protein [Bacteroidaceae bacterium]|jgi:guanosine-3',5'-bis(diphosphate) 3'-pyrophosphohydrolase